MYGTLVETSVYATLFLEYPLDENRLEMFLMVLIQRFLSYLNYSFISLIFSALLIREAFLESKTKDSIHSRELSEIEEFLH